MRMQQATVVILAGTLATVGAEAQTVDAANPDSVLGAVRAYGHKARLEMDESGFPAVFARVEDINYTIHFYGCEAPEGCTQLQFAASFDLGTGLTPEFANQWNEDWVVGRLSVNADGDPLFTSFVTTAGGGLAAGNFEAALDAWSGALLGVVEDIGY